LEISNQSIKPHSKGGGSRYGSELKKTMDLTVADETLEEYEKPCRCYWHRMLAA
jgi:hypothetical protein